MTTLLPGDKNEISFVHVPAQVEHATVCRTLTDQEEGFGPEIKDYVASWLEVATEDRVSGKRRSISMGTYLQYSLDGHRITIKKI